MPDYTLRTWIARHIQVRQRLEQVCTAYLLFLMVVTTKHTLEEAARFSAMNKSQFSKLLKFQGIDLTRDTLYPQCLAAMG